jgi:GNAT superfamily N-acetyltransferase
LATQPALRQAVSIQGQNYLFFTPANDAEFSAILELTRAVHGEGAAALSQALDQGLPGMVRSDWYGIATLDSRCAAGRILSTLCRIPGTWTCSDADQTVSLPIAELGLVATAEDARCRGLSSWLMHRFMEDSRQAGFVLSAIQGIPYYYRRFGFEYAVPLMTKIVLAPCQASVGVDNTGPGQASVGVDSTGPGQASVGVDSIGPGQAPGTADNAGRGYTIPCSRPATAADIPILAEWFKRTSASLGIRADRSVEHWDFLMGSAQLSPETAIDRRIILDDAGRPVGMLGFQRDCFGPTLAIAEASIELADQTARPGDILALAETLRQAEDLPEVTVLLPYSHPVAQAAITLGGTVHREYAWQVQLLDYAAFFRIMGPVFEARLRRSRFNKKPQRLRLDLYGRGFTFDWTGDRLTVRLDAGPDAAPDSGITVTAAAADGAALLSDIPASSLPPELLGPLVLGYRSWRELGHCRRDIRVLKDHESLLDVLFPVLDSFIYPLF